MIKIKFRPSSHSEDGTIVAVFEDKEVARSVANKIRRLGGTLWENKLMVSGSSLNYGTLREAEAIFQEAGAKSISKPKHHQELIIRVCLPTGITEDAIPLVLDSNTLKLLQELTKACGKPQREVRGKTTVLTFHYCADRKIYYPFKHPDNPYGVFRLSQQNFPVTKTFKIKGLI